VSLPEAFTTGSSIMPQKRNPDVFELMRGRSAVAHAALNEVLASPRNSDPATIAIFSSSSRRCSAHRLLPPTLDILPSALAGVAFRPEKIRLDPGSTPPRCQHLGGEGQDSIPRAYQRVAAQLKDSK